MTIAYDVSIADYHASPHVSASKLSDFAQRGPRYFASRYVTRKVSADDEERSEALVVGQAFEDKLCVPKEFDARYAVKPAEMNFSTKDGKAWRAEQEAAGKVIITDAAHAHIVEMVCAIQENESARQLIEASFQQPTIRWEHPGITPGLQARPDFYNPVGVPLSDFKPYTVDLKSTSILTRCTSGRSILDYGYHRQANMVARGLAAHGVVDVVSYLLVVEKCPAHRALVVELHPDWLVAGHRWVDEQLGKLARHFASGTWPRVEQEIITLDAPTWLRAEVENDDEVETETGEEAAE